MRGGAIPSLPHAHEHEVDARGKYFVPSYRFTRIGDERRDFVDHAVEKDPELWDRR